MDDTESNVRLLVIDAGHLVTGRVAARNSLLVGAGRGSLFTSVRSMSVVRFLHLDLVTGAPPLRPLLGASRVSGSATLNNSVLLQLILLTAKIVEAELISEVVRANLLASSVLHLARLTTVASAIVVYLKRKNMSLEMDLKEI